MNLTSLITQHKIHNIMKNTKMKNMRHFCLLHKKIPAVSHTFVYNDSTTGVTCSVAYFGSYLESLCTKIFEKLTLSGKQMVTTVSVLILYLILPTET